MTETDAAAEGKWDAAMELARVESGAAYQAMCDAADCADGMHPDFDDAWYCFAVGVAANDDRSAHLFG
jgi:hypothetical protein